MTILMLLIPMLAAGTACRMLSVPLSRNAQITYFIATALPDTLSARAGPGPAAYGLDMMSRSTPPGLRPPPPPDTGVFGQLVALDRVGGHDANRIQSYLTGGRREALLIPWAYQADCSPIVWTQSARWIAPGAVGFFTARLRPDSEWVDGRPTFDVGAAWHQPYPHGEFLKYDRRRDGGLPELTVSELWGLYEALPLADSLYLDPNSAIEAARRWARANPALAGRWPATRILELLEGHVRHRNR